MFPLLPFLLYHRDIKKMDLHKLTGVKKDVSHHAVLTLVPKTEFKTNMFRHKMDVPKISSLNRNMWLLLPSTGFPN